MTNPENRVLYVGVTTDLKGRVYQHRESLIPGFTQKYKVTKLVYYEAFGEVELAIEREKRIKGGSRKQKIALIESVNPTWSDLWEEL